MGRPLQTPLPAEDGLDTTILKQLLSVAVRKTRRNSAAHHQEAVMNSDTELVIRELIEEFDEAGLYAATTDAWKYGDRPPRARSRRGTTRSCQGGAQWR